MWFFVSQSVFQKLISDDRFRSENEEDAEYQLPVQFLTTVSSTPSLADEVQVEVMKVWIIISFHSSLFALTRQCNDWCLRLSAFGPKIARLKIGFATALILFVFRE